MVMVHRCGRRRCSARATPRRCGARARPPSPPSSRPGRTQAPGAPPPHARTLAHSHPSVMAHGHATRASAHAALGRRDVRLTLELPAPLAITAGRSASHATRDQQARALQQQQQQALSNGSAGLQGCGDPDLAASTVSASTGGTGKHRTAAAGAGVLTLGCERSAWLHCVRVAGASAVVLHQRAGRHAPPGVRQAGAARPAGPADVW